MKDMCLVIQPTLSKYLLQLPSPAQLPPLPLTSIHLLHLLPPKTTFQIPKLQLPEYPELACPNLSEYPATSPRTCNGTMSQDRWAHEFKLDSPKHSSPKATTAGIAPTSFHKKKRTANELSCTEKHLGELLQLASKNEVVQKRKDFTTGQNVRLEAYESVTSFRIFPLQVRFDYTECIY